MLLCCGKYTITSAVVGEEKCLEEFWNCLEMAEYAMMRDVLVGTQSFHLFIYFATFLGRLQFPRSCTNGTVSTMATDFALVTTDGPVTD